jgi:hypothetical protein
LQYNGFFTLSVFALLFNQFFKSFTSQAREKVSRFALVLSISVLPTLFLSYLWHFPNMVIRGIAVLGCTVLVLTLILFLPMLKSMRDSFKAMNPFAKLIGSLSMLAFFLKTAVQIGIVFPAVGNLVFGDRPIIIGYLHLVMLGFVSLYLLAHLLHTGFFNNRPGLSRRGIIVFACAVIGNEVILMTQGLAAMFSSGGSLYPWLLWIAAIFLLLGALIILLSLLPSNLTRDSDNPTTINKTEHILETIN